MSEKDRGLEKDVFKQAFSDKNETAILCAREPAEIVDRPALSSTHRRSSLSPKRQRDRCQLVVLRAPTDPVTLAGAGKQQIRALDSDLPLYNVRTTEQRTEESLARRRFVLLLTLFACVALATTGTYGVMAYLVNQGT
jgi:hypothetical protein